MSRFINKKLSGRVALVSAPWPLFNRPSIQLGTLKAYLQAEDPGLKVSCHHMFLPVAAAVGYPLYRLISRETWPAESVYAALLYPQRRAAAERLFSRRSRSCRELKGVSFAGLLKRVERASESLVEETDWAAMDLIGFSICLCQLTASLYLIRQIRQKAPEVPLIVGGSFVSGRAAADLPTVFPEIDLVIIGEGELPLSRLIACLRDGSQCRDLPAMPGLVRPGRDAPESVFFSQLPDLKTLPPPDYSEYFDTLSKLPEEKRFFPTLPAEISRGCWWRSARPGKASRPEGCAFCNLNLQWQGYRTKDTGQVVTEINTMTEKHRVLSIAFMDNALPPEKTGSVFQSLAAGGKDLSCFAELRATTSLDTLADLAAAGMTEVQIGIEALSSRLLGRLNKGTTAMDNMEIMKHCEALGLKNLANLILWFPGSDEEDVAETLRAIRFARVFRPLRKVHFWLGAHSPVWRQPRRYGLTAVFNHPHYRHLFPDSVCRRVQFPIQDYRGDKQIQKKLWRPVDRAIRQWEEDYRLLHSRSDAGPVLSCRDGGRFLLIQERRVNDEPVNHRLEGASRDIHLFCDRQQTFEAVCRRFAPLPADRIRKFLNMMTGKGLMFAEQDRFLSLAVRTRVSRSGPAV